MKLNQFEEKINSKYLLGMTILSCLFFFVIKNIYFFPPVFIFVLCLFNMNNLSLKKILKIIIGTFFFSLIYSGIVLAFPNPVYMVGKIYQLGNYQISQTLLILQMKIFVRIAMIASLSISSLYCINYEKILINLMNHKKIPVKLGYPLILAFNSIGLFKSEFEKIRINASFRNINFWQKFNIFFPLLVFSIRHAERGAMALVTRGLSDNKKYYFDTKSRGRDRLIFFIYSFMYLILVAYYLNHLE